MLIGIDGNEANVEKRVGIGEYAFELLRQFSSSKFKVQNSKFLIYLKDKPRGDFPKEREGWRYRIVGPNKLWTQFALPFNLYFTKPRPDVFFTPSHYAPRFSPIPTVISIMDLSYIHFPEMFKKSDLYQLRNWTAYSVRNAKKILTISKASKNDIIKVYQVPENRVVVTYPGVKKFSIFNFPASQRGEQFSMKSQFSNFKKIKEKYGIRESYILFVGTLQPRKNITRLIEAFSHVILRSKATKDLDSSATPQNDMDLIIVGKKGWLYEEILEAPKKFGVENNVKFLDFVPDEDLPLLYKNAICFVLPSLYEGFGLPVLEAMQYGCPVITSNVSSLPEAGGDAALYFNPEDISDIAANLRLMITKPQLRKELIKKGYQQVKKFSWEKTANATLKALTEVVNNGKSY